MCVARFLRLEAYVKKVLDQADKNNLEHLNDKERSLFASTVPAMWVVKEALDMLQGDKYPTRGVILPA